MRTPIMVALLCALGTATPARASGDERKVWTTQLADHQDFLRYSSPVGGVPFTKFVIVPDTGVTYIFWTAVFPFHYHFVTDVLLAGKAAAHGSARAFLHSERSAGWDRRFYMGAIGYREGVYAYEFLETDVPPPHVVRRVHESLATAFPAGKSKLRFRPVSERQREVLEKAPDIPWVAADFVTSDANYQLLSKGRSVGRLRIVRSSEDVAEISIDPDAIVVLEQVPDDISPVAGLLSAAFTSPLGHVSLRARAWGIPNAGLKGAIARAEPLAGKIVFYETGVDGVVLRAASEAEAKDFEDAKRERKASQTISIPTSDLSFLGLPDLVGLGRGDVGRVGTKAANLGELASRGGDGAFEVPGGFCVPFARYVEHIEAHGLTKRIAAMLTDPTFVKDRKHRKGTLAALRKAIVDAPMDKVLGDRIAAKAQSDFGGRGTFVRSSTNAEDLPGFSGAGLYDTVPNVKGRQALEQAVKQVWASVWNLRAHEERERAAIDHRAVYPAVLIQVGVNADGAGVMVTKNVFDSDGGPAVFINAKRGLGIRVVGGSRVPEQVLYDEVTRELRVISRSDDSIALVFDDKGGVREVAASKEPFLNKGRVRALVRAAKRVRKLFADGGAQDIEWLITGESQVWVVQTRPFVEAPR